MTDTAGLQCAKIRCSLRRYTTRSQAALLVAVIGLTIASPGCRWLNKDKLDYRTIPLDTQRDTEEAEKEHSKGLTVLHRYIEGKNANLGNAEKHFQKALVADVTFGPAHNSLGLVYYFQHKLYLAAWEFEYAAKVMPERVEPIYNLGLVYEAAGNLERAIEYYETALAMAPQDPAVLGSMITAQLRLGSSVEELQPMLQQLLFLDSRQDWVTWAEQQLGTHVVPITLPEAGSGDRFSPEPLPTPLSDDRPSSDRHFDLMPAMPDPSSPFEFLPPPMVD